MKKFEKIYVGKGHMPKEGMDIVRITLKMEDLKQLIYEYEGSEMVTLEVAKMKKADNFDRTHTVYGTVVAQEEKPKKKTPRKKTKK